MPFSFHVRINYKGYDSFSQSPLYYNSPEAIKYIFDYPALHILETRDNIKLYSHFNSAAKGSDIVLSY